MDQRLLRTLILSAFLLNLAFLGLVLADVTVWDNRYLIPLFVAWAVVMVLSVILGLFAKPRIQVIERVVERVIVAPNAKTAAALQAPRSSTSRASATTAATPQRPPAPVLRPSVPLPQRETKASGPFTFNGFTLHSRIVKLKGGGVRPIYFFSKRAPRSGAPATKPAGYHVGVNERTGLPFLKKGDSPDGEDLTPTHEAAYQPQCSALTASGSQCRNSSRQGSKYCASHFGYQPPTAEQVAARHDTISVRDVVDVAPSLRGKPGPDMDNEQCRALTAVGDQCRNAAREGSKYCPVHKGYQPPSMEAVVARTDTRPKVRGAKDTSPAIRRSP